MSDVARYNVLFLCTGNSARSIMAECALARFGRDRFALDRLVLQRRLDEIGRALPESEQGRDS